MLLEISLAEGDIGLERKLSLGQLQRDSRTKVSQLPADFDSLTQERLLKVSDLCSGSD